MLVEDYFNMKNLNHYILGFERRNSGAFEHAWGLAKYLSKKGFNAEYYSSWFDSPVFKANLETEYLKEIHPNLLAEKKGIFYLQTHTWEYNGFLNSINQNSNSQIIYHLHSVIPYLYLSESDKKSFLNAKIQKKIVQTIINNKLNKREKAQLSAIEKADHLIVISKAHKKILQFLEIDKPVSILENVSDIESSDISFLDEIKKKGEQLKNKLNCENIILYCGNLYTRKGSTALLKGFEKIRLNYPDSKLIILGFEEKNKEKLINYGLNKRLLKDVVPISWINKSSKQSQLDFFKYYSASDVLIQPMITNELYSKTVIDAMTLGLPTITCKSPYTIGSSENEFAIAESFNFLKQNPEEVKKITNLAKEKVSRENTWNFYFSKLEEIIKTLQ